MTTSWIENLSSDNLSATSQLGSSSIFRISGEILFSYCICAMRCHPNATSLVYSNYVLFVNSTVTISPSE